MPGGAQRRLSDRGRAREPGRPAPTPAGLPRRRAYLIIAARDGRAPLSIASRAGVIRVGAPGYEVEPAWTRHRPIMEAETKPPLKQRLVEEIKAFWVIALYLWLFLGMFVIYRRLVAAEVGAPYLHAGFAFVQAMIIAKVVLVGRMLRFTRRFDDRPLIVPVLYKSVLFGVLVVLFGIVEHVVEGWFHGEGPLGGLRTLAAIGAYELAARVVMLVVAFVPFFAFGELGRVLGFERLAAMFFSARGARAD